MKTWPKISVVTPSYNQAEFLERTILSVLSQNYPNLEHIIIDGGSTDGSVEIIERYEQHLAYWVSEPDGGQSNAINKGFARSMGEILAWLNSDDTYEPGALLAVGRRFSEEPSLDVLYGDAQFIDSEDDVIQPIKGVPFNARAFAYGGINIHQASTFWRRDLFFRVGTLNEDLYLAMDYDLWFRFVKNGASFAYLPAMLANFREHPGSKTVRASDSQETIAAKERALGVRDGTRPYRFWNLVYRARKAWFYLQRGDAAHVRLRLVEAISAMKKR